MKPPEGPFFLFLGPESTNRSSIYMVLYGCLMQAYICILCHAFALRRGWLFFAVRSD